MDPSTLSKFSKDLFYSRRESSIALRPKNTSEVVTILRAIKIADMKLVVRGGGLSYSAGYLTDHQNTAVLDMRACDQVHKIDSENMVVVVGAGISWEKLDEALKPLNLRTPFWGTGSGLHATVGGSLSQNAINYGSGKYGTAAENVIGLKVILCGGAEIRTGSWGGRINSAPFMRYYGPDLLGIFLGDNGALGVKAEVSLPLIKRPARTSFLAFAFSTLDDFVAAMSEVGRNGVVSECFGFDPSFLAERLVSGGFADNLDSIRLRLIDEYFRKLSNFNASENSRFTESQNQPRPYTIHMSIEGRDDNELSSLTDLINGICQKTAGIPIDGAVIRAIRENPFPAPEMLLGPNGFRWVPMHGVVPHSLHKKLLRAIGIFFDDRHELIQKHMIKWSHVSNLIGNATALIEVNLYWKDSLSDTIEEFLDDDFISRQGRHAHNPDSFNAVSVMRDELIELFTAFGSTHLQIGKVYPYLDTRMESVSKLVTKLKDELDPEHRINPGVLKLS